MCVTVGLMISFSVLGQMPFAQPNPFVSSDQANEDYQNAVDDQNEQIVEQELYDSSDKARCLARPSSYGKTT